jgi:hypothetical protein
MNYKELLDSVILKEVLENPNGLINIDINDIKDLFLQSEEIHFFDVRVNAREEYRMEQLVEQIKKKGKSLSSYTRALIYFFFPERNPLLMEELQPFSEWMESVPDEFMIKWGMATQSTPELRAIVLLQSDQRTLL